MKHILIIAILLISINSIAQKDINKNIINNKEIINSGATNLAELLSKTTSLDIANMPFISAGVGINGTPPTMDNSNVAILLDGRPIPVVNISDISLINVEKIEIIKGAVSAIYGLNALGGAINIITKKGKKTATTMGGGLGSFNRYILEGFQGERLDDNLYYHLSFQNDKQKDDYKIGKNNFISPSSDQEIILDPASKGARMLNSSYNKIFINAGLGYIINDNWDLYFGSTGYSHKKSKVSGSFYQTEASSNIKNYDLGTANFSFTVKGKIKKHNITLNSHYINFTDKLRLNENEEELEEDTKHIFASIKDRFEAKNFNLTIAAEYRLNKYDDFYHSYIYDDVLHKTPSFKDQVLSASLGTHIAFCNNKFNIDAAIRYDRVKYSVDEPNTRVSMFISDLKYSRKSNLFSPYINLTYNTSENSLIYANWGKSYNTPLSLNNTGLYVKYVSTSYEEIKKGEAPVNIITKHIQYGDKDYNEKCTNTVNIGFKYFSNSTNLKIKAFYIKQKHFGKFALSSTAPLLYDYTEIINNTEYFIRENIYTVSNLYAKNENYGIDIDFSYHFINTILNHFTITPYYTGTFLFKNDIEEYGDNRQRDNISNLGLKFDYKKKFYCNLNLKIASDKEIRNLFIGNINVDFDPYLDISPSNPFRHPLKDINNKPIRPELTHKNQIKLPAYGLLNFSSTYNLNKNITLGFYANNILDENYMEIDAYHMPGRNFLVKLKFNFDTLF